MQNKKVILGSIIAIILAIGFFIYWQVRLLVKAKWQYSQFKLRTISLDGVSFDVFFNVNNVGMLAVTVAEQDYNVYINDSFVSRIVSTDDQEIKAESTSPISFLINIKLSDLLKTGINNITFLTNPSEREKIKIKIDGVLTLKIGALTVKKMKLKIETTLADLKKGDE